MRVQRVLAPGSTTESWTLLGDDLRPVDPVESFLAYLTAIERSPNTVKAYAHDLKDWWIYLDGRGLDWKSVALEAVASFVAWLRLPPPARNRTVAVLPTVEHHCTASSVNRKLAAVSTFYEFHARSGVAVADLLVTMRPAGPHRSAATSYKPFLQHIASGRPERTRTIKLKNGRKHPRVLAAAQVQKILDSCEHLRDRLLFALLLDTGVRIGEALGLRHDDIAIAERQVTVVPRQNDNRARAKSGRSRSIPASAELMRLYSDYLHREYGALDSDYVFVPGSVWTELPRPASAGAEPVGYVRLGYARASTARQSLDAQLDSLAEAGVTRVFSEKISTRAAKRPELEAAVKFAGEIRSSGVAVTLVVHEHKRLGRGIELAMLAEELKASDVGLEFLTGELKGSHDPSGIVFTVLAAMSGMEREYIRDRTLEGHESARKRGKTIGGAGVTDDSMLSMALHLRDEVEMSLRDIAKRLVITTGAKKGQHPSPATVMRMLREHDERTAAALAT